MVVARETNKPETSVARCSGVTRVMSESSTSAVTTTTTTGPPPPTTREPPPLCPLQVPDDEDYDAWVLAGGRLFRAHTSVLAAHSAYLRGVAAVGAATSATAPEGHHSRGDVRLLLPHVPPAGFAAILTYMYTGRLPLTPSTLYEVLLAGHLLQMASVVSLCQVLLTNTESPTVTTATTTANAPLDLSDVPPALSMWRGLARLVPPHHSTLGLSAVASNLPATIVRPTPTRPRPLHHALATPQDFTRNPDITEEVARGVLGEGVLGARPHHDENRPLDDTAPYGQHKSSREDGDSRRVNAGAVVIDVAACDGPVFFERVINRAYKANPLLTNDDSETETEINVEEIDSCDDTMSRSGHTGLEPPSETSNDTVDKEGGHSSSALNLNTPGGGRDVQLGLLVGTSPPMPNNQTSRTYHCVYCNHTFKSHYCYQKHMRRHINPITVEVDKLRGIGLVGSSAVHPAAAGTTPVPDVGGREQVGETSSSSSNPGVKGSGTSLINGSTRSSSLSPYSSSSRCRVSPAPSEGLKILDLNVQYFPCKTCGSKFPSYYFVHKHRRLCHQEEEASSFPKKTSTNPTTPSSSASSTPTPINTPANTPNITTTAA